MNKRSTSCCTNAVKTPPSPKATDDGKRLEILDLGSRGSALCSENKGTDQLHGYLTTVKMIRRLFLPIMQDAGFIMTWFIWSNLG